MTDADNQLSKDNGTLEDAKLRAKKDALQKLWQKRSTPAPAPRWTPLL